MRRRRTRLLLVLVLLAAWGTLAVWQREGARHPISKPPVSAPVVGSGSLPSAESAAESIVHAELALEPEQRAIAAATPVVPPMVDLPAAPAPVPPPPPTPAPEPATLPLHVAEPNVVLEGTPWRPPLPERFSLTIRSGSFRPRGAGDLFATFSTALTLAPEDLRAQSIGVDGSWLMAERWELVAAIEGSSASAASQTRAPRPGGGLPVQQSTSLQLEPVGTIAIRYYLVPPFRWNGEGWVSEPSRFFLGGGLGMLAYTLRQQGEFFDEAHARTFLSDLESSGRGRIAFLTAGIDVPLFARIGGLVEARYQVSDAPLAAGFAAFERIDLSGLRLSVGIQRRW